MNKNIKKISYEIEESYKKKIEAISDYIFKHPELGEVEFLSSKYLIDQLKDEGFTVEENYSGLPTAFRAEYGDDSGPTIALSLTLYRRKK